MDYKTKQGENGNEASQMFVGVAGKRSRDAVLVSKTNPLAKFVSPRLAETRQRMRGEREA